jgi:hypothetical protein
MGVSGQHHAPAALLPPGKGPPVPIGQEAGWAPEPVWTQRLEEKYFAPAGNRTPRANPAPLKIVENGKKNKTENEKKEKREKEGKVFSTSASYWGSPGFKSRLGDRISRLSFFVAFLSLIKQVSRK